MLCQPYSFEHLDAPPNPVKIHIKEKELKKTLVGICLIQFLRPLRKTLYDISDINSEIQYKIRPSIPKNVDWLKKCQFMQQHYNGHFPFMDIRKSLEYNKNIFFTYNRQGICSPQLPDQKCIYECQQCQKIPHEAFNIHRCVSFLRRIYWETIERGWYAYHSLLSLQHVHVNETANQYIEIILQSLKIN